VALVVAAVHSVGVPLQAVPDHVHPDCAVQEPEVKWASQATDTPEQEPGEEAVQVHPRDAHRDSLVVLAQV
jgi:hypothetical protein